MQEITKKWHLWYKLKPNKLRVIYSCLKVSWFSSSSLSPQSQSSESESQSDLMMLCMCSLAVWPIFTYTSTVQYNLTQTTTITLWHLSHNWKIWSEKELAHIDRPKAKTCMHAVCTRVQQRIEQDTHTHTRARWWIHFQLNTVVQAEVRILHNTADLKLSQHKYTITLQPKVTAAWQHYCTEDTRRKVRRKEKKTREGHGFNAKWVQC